ncbi:CU044_5270 family protein [Kutzneria chonburiensis]|uniref:CU044_5270 family protein n=1 Tax=Kutzneria chonburiensis TaxID=1483604 RepID=A0ABV6N270_9PSEU|nr:CU044_5270 family protein [Kutzneria chonburiensis]
MSELDDDRVDAAVGAVRSDAPQMSEASFQATRARVLAATADNVVPLRRRRALLIGAAAAVATVIGIAVMPGSPDSPAPYVSAAPVLNKAADVTIGSAPDPVVGAGQYLLVQRDQWTGGPYESTWPADYAYLAEVRTDIWIPADRSKSWKRVVTVSPDPKMLYGDEAKARANLAEWRKAWDGTTVADGGDFYHYPGGPEAAANLGSPTPKYLAGLPADPKQLYDALEREQRPDFAGTDERLLEAAGAGLASGLMPTEFRARLYRALTYIKGLEVVDQVANLDGKKGVALGLRAGYPGGDTKNVETQLIIDPATGQFIGEREVAMQDFDGVHTGTVLSYSSVTSKVVDHN